MRTSRRTAVIAEAALSIALAAVLHIVTRAWQMPWGGTISLEMLPILVLALRRGVLVGVAAGALFGVIDFLLEPFVVHWVQVFLDYPLAFGLLGLAGFGAPAWHRAAAEGRSARAAVTVVAPFSLLGIGARFAAHFVSGAVFFATTVAGGPLAEGQSSFASAATLRTALAYSAVYNATYLVPSAILCVVAVALVMPPLERAVPSQ